MGSGERKGAGETPALPGAPSANRLETSPEWPAVGPGASAPG